MTFLKALLPNCYSFVWGNRRLIGVPHWMGNSNVKENYHNYQQYDSQVRVLFKCIFLTCNKIIYMSLKMYFLLSYIFCLLYIIVKYIYTHYIIIKYASHILTIMIINLQYSLSNLLSGSCVTTTQASNEEQRSLFRASHKRWIYLIC